MSDAQKKRKASGKEDADAIPSKKKSPTPVSSAKNDKAPLEAAGVQVADDAFKPLSLTEIRDRMADLAKQVPEIPAEGFYVEGANPKATSKAIGEPPDNLKREMIKRWANELQVVLEELGLLLCCVSTACYRWGTDRSGAADQNLSVLNEELNSTQEQIASRVTPRLRNVLTPVVDLVVEKTITTKIKRPKVNMRADGGVEEVEEKLNVFTRKLEDPDFVHLCYEILARNAPMMRLVVMTNFAKMLECIKDYLSAQNNDTQHHREFAY
jgi:hypothetical protein